MKTGLTTALCLVFFSLSGGGCTVAEDPPMAAQESKANMQPEIEPVDDPAFSDGKIQFTAISNGCTTAANFVVQHTTNNGNCEVTLLRTEPDYCRKTSMPIQLTVDWELPAECQGMEVVFSNPVITTQNAGKPVALPETLILKAEELKE